MKNNFFIDNNIRINPKVTPAVRPQQEQAPKTPFSAYLNQEIQGDKEVKFSRHAQERLMHRNISLSGSSMEKLSSAVDKAEAKGAKESLILMDDLAFVVSIKNRTVITAVDGNSMKENVFTNIDSAVIV